MIGDHDDLDLALFVLRDYHQCPIPSLVQPLLFPLNETRVEHEDDFSLGCFAASFHPFVPDDSRTDDKELNVSSTIPSSGSGLKMNSVFKNRKLAHFCFSSSLESPLSNDELEQGFSLSLDVFDL